MTKDPELEHNRLFYQAPQIMEKAPLPVNLETAPDTLALSTISEDFGNRT